MGAAHWEDFPEIVGAENHASPIASATVVANCVALGWLLTDV